MQVILGKEPDDLVCSYANEVMTLGLIWLNFYDAVKEGDGDSVKDLEIFNGHISCN